jgi:hypothetical protein
MTAMNHTPPPAQTIPLALLADAWNTATDALAAELGDKILVDDLQVRHVRCDDAHELLAQRKAREQAQRQEQAARAAVIDAQSLPLIQRVAAIRAQQHRMRQDGQIDADASAFVAMAAGENEARLSPASRRMDGWLAGRSEGAMFQPQPARKD